MPAASPDLYIQATSQPWCSGLFSYFCPYIFHLVVATHFPLDNCPTPFQVILKENGYHGTPPSLGHKVRTCDPDLASQSSPFFHQSNWLRNGCMTQFSPSRVLPITFPLELIEISPTLEIAKLEECEPEAAGGHVALIKEKSYWRMNPKKK